MKFSKLLIHSLDEQYEPYYINYKYLKGKIKYSILHPLEFLNLLLSEIDRVETFYSNNTSKPLKEFCISNLLAVIKITKKYNKHNPINITNTVYKKISTYSFYNYLFTIDILPKYKTNQCEVCYMDNQYILSLPCNHKLCWNCCLKCHLNNYKKCPFCLEDTELNPLILKLEEITKKNCNPIYKSILNMKTKVLLIGIDGLRPDCLLFANTPNLDKLIQQSSFSFDAIINSHTLSGPSWSSIFTGKPPSFTGITSNEMVENKSFKFQSDNLFQELHKKNVDTHCVLSSWVGITTIVQECKDIEFIDKEETPENDNSIIEKTYDIIHNPSTNSQFVFSYLNSIDDYGHKYGFSLQSKEYINRIEEIDSSLSKVLDQAILDGWTILITTDHGGSKYSDLTNEYQEKFKQLDYVASQLDKQSVGVHGLDIPQHKRVFQLYHGKTYTKKEITKTMLSTDIYKEIIELF